MLDNNKCILVYRLPENELKALKEENIKVIEIKPEMVEMKIKDILDGLKFQTINESPIKEKVILFNNFTDIELQALIKNLRKNIKGGILAVVTPTSSEWSFNYLIEHLVEEREWYLKQQKGR
ncbi:DUF3783 domain-containing protein [Clostridium carnis]